MKNGRRQGLPWYVLATTGATLVGCLAVTGFMVYLSVSYASRTSAYDSARTCSSAREIAGCRYEGSALIQAKRQVNPDLLVDLVFADFPAETHTAYFDQKDTAAARLQQGSAVPAEFWQGNVTTVGGVKTLDNPDTLPTSGPPVAAFFGFVTLVVLAILIYLRRVDRRATDRPQSAAR